MCLARRRDKSSLLLLPPRGIVYLTRLPAIPFPRQWHFYCDFVIIIENRGRVNRRFPLSFFLSFPSNEIIEFNNKTNHFRKTGRERGKVVIVLPVRAGYRLDRRFSTWWMCKLSFIHLPATQRKDYHDVESNWLNWIGEWGEGREFFFFWRHVYLMQRVCRKKIFIIRFDREEMSESDQTWLVGKEGSWSSKRRDDLLNSFFFFLQCVQHYSLTLDNLLQFVTTFTVFETKVSLASSSSPPALTLSRLCYCTPLERLQIYYTREHGNVRRLDAGEPGKVGYWLKRVAAGIGWKREKEKKRRGVV